MKITDDTKIEDILKQKQFQEFSHLLFPDMGMLNIVLRYQPLKVLRKAWPENQIAEGLECLKEHVENGEKVFYELYSKDEIKENPSFHKCGLFHFPVKNNTKFVVICAGGGYTTVCSCVEAFPTAMRLNELGYHAFVLNYRYGKDAAVPNPVEDLARGISYILMNAEKLNVEKRDYAVAGFSAGGHLVGLYGTEKNGCKKYGLPKPGALFLAYPVVTMGSYTHKDSRKNFLGRRNVKDVKLQERYSVEKQVTGAYPPCFVWQCERDRTVSIENSRMLVQALQKFHIAYQYKTYDSDVHGWGLGDGTPAEGWLKEAVKFWEAGCNPGIF